MVRGASAAPTPAGSDAPQQPSEETVPDSIDRLVTNTIKTLAIDAIDRANSGHPGLPMGMAGAASTLWRRFLTVDPTAPGFVDRDRFVLSGGHGSMLLYALLHLSGFDVSLDDIKAFRQLHSKTPGHPEVGVTPGVETTTGPLGQGFANAVGMAMAEAYLAAHFNHPGFDVVDHWTYATCGDGDLEEGLSHEAAALAGHLGLGKLVVLFDDNGITIEGPTSLATSVDVTGRFEAYGWQVLEVNGHDHAAVAGAIEEARAVRAHPTLIRCHTHIGQGSPHRQDTAGVHGSPLGAEETRATKVNIGWPPEAHFLVPDEARGAFDELRARGAARREAWEAMFTGYAQEHADLAATWERIHATGEASLPGGLAGLDALLPRFGEAGKQDTRASSGVVINALAGAFPELWGGSADLAGSTKTLIKGAPSLEPDAPGGRNIHFGIREHGMGGVLNGIALHGGLIPYGATFLTFSDYMRGAVRLSALMGQRAVYVFTHDSVFLGEDGPTHQAVEHAMALRLIPNLEIIRPADGNETAAAWRDALRHGDRPTALLLTRQGVPQVTPFDAALEGVAQGAYVLQDAGDGAPDLVLLASGSEVHVALAAARTLGEEGTRVRVVSVPNLGRFLAQPAATRDAVIPPGCLARLSVEAGVTRGWEPLLGPLGEAVGIDRFGESAPAGALAELFGLTPDAVADRARQLLRTLGTRAAALRARLASVG